MKVNPNYVRRTFLDETVIIPTGGAIKDFNGMISTNAVAGFIWEHIEDCETPADMVEKVCEAFEVDHDTAEEDVTGFLNTLRDMGMIAF